MLLRRAHDPQSGVNCRAFARSASKFPTLRPAKVVLRLSIAMYGDNAALWREEAARRATAAAAEHLTSVRRLLARPSLITQLELDLAVSKMARVILAGAGSAKDGYLSPIVLRAAFGGRAHRLFGRAQLSDYAYAGRDLDPSSPE